MSELTCPATPPLSKCPETPPRAGSSKSSPSTWNETADSKQKSPNRPSSPENCAICLGVLANKSFTNSCCHQFCFVCLLEWSKVKAECPLCKVAFDSIIHNVRSQDDYDQYHVVKEATRNPPGSSVVLWTHPNRHHYRAFSEWMANRGMATLRVANNFLTEAVPSGPSHNSSYTLRSRRRSPSRISEFRRSIYDRDLWARLQPDFTGRYRECSPEFYMANPAQMQRLVPFIVRELEVLLGSGTRITYTLDKILALLPRYSMTSSTFRREIAQLIGHQHTPHFCHELRAFASSPYDMVGYDRAVQYHPNGGAGYSIEIDSIDSDNTGNATDDTDDDDIQIIETRPEPALSMRPIPSTSTSVSGGTSPVEPIVLDPGPSTSQGFSAIFTPSHQNASVVQLSSSSESDDPEAVQIVGYVKPRHERTPEIITLSSPERSPRTTSHHAATSWASDAHSGSPDELTCITLGNTTAEHKWQDNGNGESSDDMLLSKSISALRAQRQSTRKSRGKKPSEALKPSSSTDSWSSSSSSDCGGRWKRNLRRKKTKGNVRRKDSRSSKINYRKSNVVSSDSENENQPSTSRGRCSRRRESRNSPAAKSTNYSAKVLDDSDCDSKFKSSPRSPVSSSSDNSPPRSTIRSAIVPSTLTKHSSSLKDGESPSRNAGPKLRNIVVTRTTTEEGHDSWRVAETGMSPESHKNYSTTHERHRSSSYHSSKSPSRHRHHSSSRHSKHHSNCSSEHTHSKRRKGSESRKDSRHLQKNSKKICREESRSCDLSQNSQRKLRALSFSESDSS